MDDISDRIRKVISATMAELYPGGDPDQLGISAAIKAHVPWLSREYSTRKKVRRQCNRCDKWFTTIADSHQCKHCKEITQDIAQLAEGITVYTYWKPSGKPNEKYPK